MSLKKTQRITEVSRTHLQGTKHVSLSITVWAKVVNAINRHSYPQKNAFNMTKDRQFSQALQN